MLRDRDGVVQTLDPDRYVGKLCNLISPLSAHLFEGTTQIVFVCVTYIPGA